MVKDAIENFTKVAKSYGATVHNARVEGDTIIADVEIPAPTRYVTLDFNAKRPNGMTDAEWERMRDEWLHLWDGVEEE